MGGNIEALIETAALDYTSNTGLDSIAVLPLENLNGSSETEYFADGLTEGLINKLSVTSNFRVIARNTVFRYRGKQIDIKEVGGILGVARGADWPSERSRE
jgi:TolB-like protein